MTEETPKVVEIDCTTGESIVRDMTEEEIANRNELAKQSAEREKEEAARLEEKENNLNSATTKLASLGLNPSEISAILGK